MSRLAVLVYHRKKKTKQLSNTPPKNVLSLVWSATVLLQECPYCLPGAPSSLGAGGSSSTLQGHCLSPHRCFLLRRKETGFLGSKDIKASEAWRVSGGHPKIQQLVAPLSKEPRRATLARGTLTGCLLQPIPALCGEPLGTTLTN